MKPAKKPVSPNFSSGPTTKFPGWRLDMLSGVLAGRSHRSAPAKAKLKDIIETHRELLAIPANYYIGIVPASDTGAVEMAMWSMLGQRGVDVVAWENFSNDWLLDSRDHLKLDDLRIFEAPYGELPDLSQLDPDRDIVFPWNGTTSGVRVPNGDWIKPDRKGLTICDATSAVFAYDIPWDKLDVTTWSWQKVLGSEAAHGMLVLSPRAVERLESYTPDRPLPKIFRMTKKGKLNTAIFEGSTINTPSMLAVEDCLVALNWVRSIGGMPEMMRRSQKNYEAVAKWLESSNIFEFLCTDENVRSTTSLCLKVKDPWLTAQSDDEQKAFIKSLISLIDKEGAGHDFNAYRTAPAGLRIWGGGTVEDSDISCLLEWIDWAYAQLKSSAQEAA